METILTEEQSSYIYRISYLSLISFVYALVTKQYTVILVPGSVFLTSIHYWKRPDYSYRRYLDMFVVKSALLYQTYMAYGAQYSYEYYTFICLALSLYPVGIYYYKKKDYWKSTYAHMGLHIVANIGNIILYSGYLRHHV